jgi:CBS domain-containing protein
LLSSGETVEIELKEIRDFLAGIPPFDRLPMALVEKLTHETSIRYIRRGLPLPPDNVTQDRLYLIRKGALSLQSTQGNLLGKLSEGDICTIFCMHGDHDKFIIDVEEDTLVYTIPCDTLYDIVRDHPTVAAFIQKTASQRLKDAVSSMMNEAALTSPLMHTSTQELMNSPVVSVVAGTSIYDAARSMADNGISSLMITDNGKAVGIITNSDILQRCVAARLSTDAPIDTIMTSKMLSVTSDSSAYDTLMIMTRKHIHHLPVIDDGQLNGIITVTDLIRQEGRNSAYLSSAIRKADSIDALIEHSRTIPQLQLQLVKMGGTSEHVGKGITAITTAITSRLIELAEAEIGPAPLPYAWVVAGSQARREQTSHSDQDNGLIISDALSDNERPWFEALAKYVCDGLDACGYVYCPGNVMATNPKWRQTESVWKNYFKTWINEPDPKALMHSSIFFDLRTIHGDKSLLRRIRKQMLQQTSRSTLFLAHLTTNAMKQRPPLGFFRDFVLIHDGEHNDTLDLKHNGLAPIVDLARIYALTEGINTVNTAKRLKLAAGTASLSKEGAANLLDALIFIGTLRTQHQAKQIINGVDIDNFMSPIEISRLEREHLKDAFKVIQTMQTTLERRL